MVLHVFLVGRLRLVRDDVVVDERVLGGQQPRLAAALLLAEHRRPIPQTELAEVLWAGRPPRTQATALRGVVAKVRRFLTAAGLPADTVLRTEAGVYRVDLPPDTVVDIEVASRAVERAEDGLADGDVDGAVDAASTARAVAGDQFLPGADTPWAETKREELGAWRRRATLTLARARLVRGEAELAARAAQEVIVREPLLESAHRLLLSALVAAGERGMALQAYDRLRRIVAEELGVGPSRESQWLYSTLLDDGLGMPRDRFAAGVPGSAPRMLA